uniref:Uncharacterized protein n=1 Tax=Parascaris univalens TaxID=6257 RepID=A0A915BVL8_PARUN
MMHGEMRESHQTRCKMCVRYFGVSVINEKEERYDEKYNELKKKVKYASDTKKVKYASDTKKVKYASDTSKRKMSSNCAKIATARLRSLR